ncbi:MAG: inositol monophosphatase family protein [Chloroflexota bacterium]
MQNESTIAQWETWRSVAEKAAREAGQIILQKREQPLQRISKGFRDLVTDADFAAQQCITEMVKTEFPTHGFLAEEEDAELPDVGDARWIIDPIDGTSNYSRHMTNFCVSIGVLSRDNQLVVGVIYDPLHDELFSATLGQGATRNRQSIHVSDIKELSEAALCLDWGRKFEERDLSLRTLSTLGHNVRTIRAIGSAALALAWIACGRLDAYLNYNLGAWDVAGGSLLVTEAGGTVSSMSGMPLVWGGREKIGAVVSAGPFHQELLTYMLSSVDP